MRTVQCVCVRSKIARTKRIHCALSISVSRNASETASFCSQSALSSARLPCSVSLGAHFYSRYFLPRVRCEQSSRARCNRVSVEPLSYLHPCSPADRLNNTHNCISVSSGPRVWFSLASCFAGACRSSSTRSPRVSLINLNQIERVSRQRAERKLHSATAFTRESPNASREREGRPKINNT